MKTRRFFCAVLFLICLAAVFAPTLSGRIATFLGLRREQPAAYTSTPNTRGYSLVEGVGLPQDPLNARCLRREKGVCMVCGIDAATSTTASNKTKTSLFTCSGMKPGRAKLIMVTHAGPVNPGLWEVEFGLGYYTSARQECPHQFIASNHPPIRAAYEIGPVAIDAEIPPDGIIQALVCVGLSSARVGGEGKETGAALTISKLQILSQ